MAYFEDLSLYRYGHEPTRVGLNVGWLGDGRPFQTGHTPDAFRAALAELCSKNAIHRCRGNHACEICPDASWNEPYYYDQMGNGEIWVRDGASTWYAAPRLIIHYVEKHNYCPPRAFIQAVMSPSEIGGDDWTPLSEEEEDARTRDHDRKMRELRGERASDAEIDKIVQRAIPEIRSKRPWWRRF